MIFDCSNADVVTAAEREATECEKCVREILSLGRLDSEPLLCVSDSNPTEAAILGCKIRGTSVENIQIIHAHHFDQLLFLDEAIRLTITSKQELRQVSNNNNSSLYYQPCVKLHLYFVKLKQWR